MLPALLLIRGVALGLYPSAEDPARALDEIAALGADHVSLAVFWRQRDVHADGLAPDPAVTVSDARLRQTIRCAHARGLRVLLFPIVDLGIIRPGEWRGTLAPRDPAGWWRSYETFILHYAALAADERVALLSLGSELSATETWRDRWGHLAGKARRIFPGSLVYSANWDHYQHVTFWDRVDYLGVSGYWELSRSHSATVAELIAAWQKVRAPLARVAARAGRPLLFTEIGYPSVDGAAARPWDYTRGGPVDLEEQRRLYAAFVAAWRGDPVLAGVFFWDWRPGGPRDRGYSPRGKPAEAVMRDYFRQP